MNDMKISAQVTIAYTLWVVGFGLALLYAIFAWRTGAMGVLCAGVAMVLQIRGFFCALLKREEAAFQLGAEAGRLHVTR